MTSVHGDNLRLLRLENEELNRQVERLVTIEKRLEDSEDRFRALSQATFEAIFISDKGICIDTNDAASEMFGHTYDELIGIFGTDVIADESKELVKQNMLAGHQEPYQAVAVRKDGSTFPCEIQGKMFEYRGRQVRVTALRDISVQVAIQERLTRSEKMEALGTLAGGIAHDFNNLLTIILGQTDLLLAGGPDGMAATKLHTIRKAGRRASGMVRQLLSFSRQDHHDSEPVDLNGLLRDWDGILRPLVREDTTLDLDLDPGDPVIMIDPNDLEQIVINLITNARDAVQAVAPRDKRISLRTRVLPEGKVELEIGDNGIGMDREQQAQAFDPFFTTKAPNEGTGLGLASVYGLVRRHGGGVDMESRPGVGTTVTVSFPATQEEPIAQEGARSRPETGQGTVLLVEDNPEVLEVIAMGLKMFGIQVLQAPGTQAARTILQERGAEVDVLVTDQIMPDGPGLELIAWARENSPVRRFVLVSGYTFGQLDSLNQLPADVAFLAKPFLPEELVRILEQEPEA